MKIKLLSAAVLAFSVAGAQNLPDQWAIDEANHMITIGGVDDDGLYDKSIIRDFYLTFDQSNYWTLLTQGYTSGTDVEADLTVDGVTYPSVGVGFKGQTSYMMVSGQKKSFSIKMDSFVAGQDLMGYKTLNLNNCYEDPSFLREFLYLHLIRNHIPAAKASFVHLYINGQDWGLYPNVQQMNKDYLEEWFLSNDGTLWRADSPTGTTGGGPGGGPGGGAQWGDGTAALNYLGDTEADYSDYYTLKSTNSTDPWQYLINTCDVLENTPIANMMDQLPAVMDVDRALWFLACENAFGDDDSYIYKGKMDYYAYWEAETGRMTPLEYDGNSVLVSESANWGLFYHADNANYPLLYQLMQVPAYRQRYLAHMRTVINELVDLTMTQNLIDEWDGIINGLVQSDPKKLYTYSNYTSELTTLQNRLTNRRNIIVGNSEYAPQGATISAVNMTSENGVWVSPVSSETPTINATVTSSNGLAVVNLYYSNALVGNFTMVSMTNSGGDNWSAQVPAFEAGSVVRFYIEAVESNTAGTRSYNPVGAEHDVYYYSVTTETAESTDIVINELMADNGITALDEMSENEDWIELYNRGTSAVNLSGYYLTDNDWNLTKWELPEGTILEPDQYLIIWADEDSAQGPMHANFKLSASGERLMLINSNAQIADDVTFGTQSEDQGYARRPNGYGDFEIQGPTFSYNNDLVSVDEIESNASLGVYPNPFSANGFSLTTDGLTSGTYTLKLYDLTGRVCHQETVAVNANTTLNINPGELSAGTYMISLETEKAGIRSLIVKN